jgi:hypothetical protein
VTANLHSPIAGAGLVSETALASRAAEDEAEDRERSEDAWALAIAQTLMEGVRPKLALPASPEASAASVPALSAGAELAATPAPTEMDAGAAENGAKSTSTGPTLPSRITTELSDSRLGRMQLSVARGPSGLHIVINVADSHVKALIEAEQALLWKSLQGCGLRIDSVRIGNTLEAGTGLAPEEASQERALARSRGNPNLRSGSARWRGYAAPTDEEPEDDAERVDLTA